MSLSPCIISQKPQNHPCCCVWSGYSRVLLSPLPKTTQGKAALSAGWLSGKGCFRPVGKKIAGSFSSPCSVLISSSRIPARFPRRGADHISSPPHSKMLSSTGRLEFGQSALPRATWLSLLSSGCKKNDFLSSSSSPGSRDGAVMRRGSRQRVVPGCNEAGIQLPGKGFLHHPPLRGAGWKLFWRI